MNILLSAIKMLGGLVLLIYGMKILSSQLRKLSGGNLEEILTNATDNPFKGLVVGFLITVATQSSSATTVIVVSLVNSGILKLRNSIPIIMGANIGTTINSQILRLANLEGSSFIALVSPSNIAPLLLLAGLLVMERSKKQKSKDIGQMVLGLGLLFTGMVTMVDMASPFSELPVFATVIQKLSNPILGVLAGTIITAIVQSSAATVGILQALSTTGIITYASTIPIILGQNIGTCVTSILASTGGNKNAKRVAAVHLYFNLIGTIIFLVGIYSYQYLIGFSFWNSSVDMGGIANFHTVFNVVSTILLFPFAKQIEKLTIFTIREDKNKYDNEDDYLIILNKLDSRVNTIPGISITNSVSVIEKMGDISKINFQNSMDIFNKYDPKKLERIQEREDIIDKIDERVAKYLVDLGTLDLSNNENNSITALLKAESEFEKVGDYAYKFAKTVELINEKDIKFSEIATKNLNASYQITVDIIEKTLKLFEDSNLDLMIEIQALCEISELKREQYKTEHIERLKHGKCNVESGISFLEILAVFEKIANHCLNISVAVSNLRTDEEFTTKQDYLSKIYQKNSSLLQTKLNEYILKYT